MGNIEANVVRMEAELQQWGAQLDGLVAAAAGAEMTPSHPTRIAELEAQLRQWSARRDELMLEAKDAAAPAALGLQAKHRAAQARIEEIRAAAETRGTPVMTFGGKLEDYPVPPEEHVARLAAQLKTWAAQLDALVAGYLKAGAQAHDAFPLRVQGLRARLQALQAKLDQWSDPAGHGGPWAAFRATQLADWAALEEGLRAVMP